MPPGIALASAVLCAVLAAGCGGGDDQPRSEPDAATAEVEATLDRLVASSDSAASCDLLSSRQLTESFGKRDPLARCRGSFERRGDDNPFTTYEVVDVERGCARVNVEDQRGREAAIFMRETDGRWLVDNIEVPPVSSSVNICGRVRLFAGEGSG